MKAFERIASLIKLAGMMNPWYDPREAAKYQASQETYRKGMKFRTENAKRMAQQIPGLPSPSRSVSVPVYRNGVDTGRRNTVQSGDESQAYWKGWDSAHPGKIFLNGIAQGGLNAANSAIQGAVNFIPGMAALGYGAAAGLGAGLADMSVNGASWKNFKNGYRNVSQQKQMQIMEPYQRAVSKVTGGQLPRLDNFARNERMNFMEDNFGSGTGVGRKLTNVANGMNDFGFSSLGIVGPGKAIGSIPKFVRSKAQRQIVDAARAATTAGRAVRMTRGGTAMQGLYLGSGAAGSSRLDKDFRKATANYEDLSSPEGIRGLYRQNRQFEDDYQRPHRLADVARQTLDPYDSFGPSDPFVTDDMWNYYKNGRPRGFNPYAAQYSVGSDRDRQINAIYEAQANHFNDLTKNMSDRQRDDIIRAYSDYYDRANLPEGSRLAESR